jgi:hypothetical protein
MTLAPGDANCENEGSYPGVDVNSGDVYAAYEFNGFTNVLNPACFNTPTRNTLVRSQFACPVMRPVSPCGAPAGSASQPVTSLDGAFIPGYNRFPANDFPRIAVDPAAGTVSMVWNDARLHPLGDILLRSFALPTLDPVQPAPVVLNQDSGGLHFLPALRNVSATGKLAVSWYDRSGANTAITDVRAALGLNPGTTNRPATNALVTSVPTDWNSVSSDIVPTSTSHGRMGGSGSHSRSSHARPCRRDGPTKRPSRRAPFARQVRQSTGINRTPRSTTMPAWPRYPRNDCRRRDLTARP